MSLGGEPWENSEMGNLQRQLCLVSPAPGVAGCVTLALWRSLAHVLTSVGLFLGSSKAHGSPQHAQLGVTGPAAQPEYTDHRGEVWWDPTPCLSQWKAATHKVSANVRSGTRRFQLMMEEKHRWEYVILPRHCRGHILMRRRDSSFLLSHVLWGPLLPVP